MNNFMNKVATIVRAFELALNYNGVGYLAYAVDYNDQKLYWSDRYSLVREDDERGRLRFFLTKRGMRAAALEWAGDVYKVVANPSLYAGYEVNGELAFELAPTSDFYARLPWWSRVLVAIAKPASIVKDARTLYRELK